MGHTSGKRESGSGYGGTSGAMKACQNTPDGKGLVKCRLKRLSKRRGEKGEVKLWLTIWAHVPQKFSVVRAEDSERTRQDH